MNIYLYRHGETAGNREKRYVGSTDEGLTAEAARKLKEKTAPAVDWVYTSPRLRCRETAEILFPGIGRTEVPGLAECDFGLFEYKNYRELTGDPDYQSWIDSGGTIGFPGGESRETFQNRCMAAFSSVLADAGRRRFEAIALVVHGGTIMAILSRIGVPKRDYFDWQAGNGCCVKAEEREGLLFVRENERNYYT